jgi:phospholipase/lecithinase/hemolysin
MVGQGQTFFKGCRDSLEQQNQWIDDVETVMRAMQKSDLFVDNCHPGDRAHKMLFEYLVQYFRANPI